MLRNDSNQIKPTRLFILNFVKNNSFLILVLAIYLIVGIILFPHYQYVINADGFSYVTIAQKYAYGNFNNAINGLWSPFMSWLLSFLLLFNSSPEYSVYAFKILSLVIGLFTLIGIHLLSMRFEIDENIRKLILIFSIPMILFLSLVKTTPDLLLLTFILLYLYVIFNPNYSNNLFNIVLCGIIGSLAYLTKSYIFIFFPVHFTLINLYNYFKIDKNRTKLFKTLFIGLTTFFIISSIWVGLISDKYGYFTTGTAAEYNHDLVGPNSQWHPMMYKGLFKPPNKTALSAWEDPTFQKMESWNPFSSWKLFLYQLTLISDSFSLFIWILFIFSPLSIVILLISIKYCIKKPKNMKSNKVIIYSLMTIFIYTIGFFVVNFEPRYILIDYVLLFLLGGYLLTILYKNYLKKSILVNFLVMIVMFSFIASPVIYLNDNFDQNKDLYHLSQYLKNDYNIKGNTASNSGLIGWEKSHFISYYLNNQYYGGITENNVENLKKELNENNINYYLIWSSEKNNSAQLPFKESYSGSITYRKNTVYLKIYSIS